MRYATNRVKWSGIDGLVDLVSTGDRVGGQERDNLERREVAGILEASENAGNAILRLRDQANDSGDGSVGTTSHELDLRCTL